MVLAFLQVKRYISFQIKGGARFYLTVLLCIPIYHLWQINAKMPPLISTDAGLQPQSLDKTSKFRTFAWNETTKEW